MKIRIAGGLAALALVACKTPQWMEEPGATAELPPWEAMDYGPFLSSTVDAPAPEGNTALKGVAIPLEDGRAGMLFDTELLRMAAGWTGGFLELDGVTYNGSHGPVPKVQGEMVFGTAARPGWAVENGGFHDPRPMPHGPLPKSVGEYRGLYVSGDRVVLSYEISGCDILESPRVLHSDEHTVLARSIDLGNRGRQLTLLVAEEPGAKATTMSAMGFTHPVARLQRGVEETAFAVRGLPEGGRWEVGDGSLALVVPPSDKRTRIDILAWRQASFGEAPRFAPGEARLEWLGPLTHGGASRWGDPLVTQGVLGENTGAWAVDTLTVPYDNPWRARMRIGALDFFDDGRIAVSTWDGDVWIVSGADADLDELQWQRFASGLFAPLGLKIVDGVIHTLGRDQITRLHDRNGDGEADFYECFNNDVLITRNFHEFAFDLQTDAAGNFYFSKGGPVKPGGRGFDKIVPHHGTILKVSPDGANLEVFATGLRAPNGIGVGPDGILTSGDNEGTWTPRCRLNWIREGTFCGCLDLAHRDPTPEIYDPPVCWMPMEIDNSSGGQVWVTSEEWGPFTGELLHLSYGQSSLYKVLLQEVDGVMQGGVTRFPLTFASSCMRARFHPIDRQLYLCGLKGWQTNAAKLSAVHRVRYTGLPAYMVGGLEVLAGGIRLTFTEALDPELANDPESFEIARWNYRWTERYGSPEVLPGSEVEIADDDWVHYKEHEDVEVRAATLSESGHSVFLAIDDLRPVMQMRIRYDLDAADGAAVRGEVHHSIHRVPVATAPE